MIYYSDQFQTNNNYPDDVPKRRVYSDENVSRLKQSLEEESWDDVFKTECVDQSYEIFIEIFMSHVNRNIPFSKPKSKNYKRSPRLPWITNSILRSINRKKIDCTINIYQD